MDKLRIVTEDFLGLWRVCGLTIALRWLMSIPVCIVAILHRRDLQPADRMVGPGPFQVSLSGYGLKFRVAGPGAISGIREMYIRDAYLKDSTLTIKDGDTVLDLGANMGNFTNLALAHGSNVKVVAVEPNSGSINTFMRSIDLNPGFRDRVKLIRAFVGTMGEKQERLRANGFDYNGAVWMSEDDLISAANLKSIDFLKCDIEGGEFDLLAEGSNLLAMTKVLAIEVHSFAGDVDSFLKSVEERGFTMLSKKYDPDGTCTALAKRL